MDSKIYDLYTDVVNYVKHLEDTLKDVIGEEAVSEIRKQYIKPTTNVTEEWLKK